MPDLPAAEAALKGLNATPAGTGLDALPPSPNVKPIPNYWLCQFDVRVDLPASMPPSNMEKWIASVVANAAVAAGQPGNVQVTLIATSEGSVSHPTATSSIAIPGQAKAP